MADQAMQSLFGDDDDQQPPTPGWSALRTARKRATWTTGFGEMVELLGEPFLEAIERELGIGHKTIDGWMSGISGPPVKKVRSSIVDLAEHRRALGPSAETVRAGEAAALPAAASESHELEGPDQPRSHDAPLHRPTAPSDTPSRPGRGDRKTQPEPAQQPTPASDTAARLARAQKKQREQRGSQTLQLKCMLELGFPAADHPRLAAAHELAAADDAPICRKLLAADDSPRVFGQAPFAQVLVFDQRTAGSAVEETLWPVGIFGRINPKATLLYQPDGVPFLTGNPGPSGRRTTLRGAPPEHQIKTRILTLLERGGIAPEWLISRFAHPFGSRRTVKDHLRDLIAYGLVEYAEDYRITDHVTEGKLPRLYRLSAKGWNSYVRRILRSNRKRYDRKPFLVKEPLEHVAHHVGALAYLVALIDVLPYVTDNWCTPAWTQGHIDVPRVSVPYAQAGEPKTRPLELQDHSRNDDIGYVLPDTPVEEIKPDGYLELEVPLTSGAVRTLPLLVEYDRRRDVEYNLRKLLKWEAWRVAWAREHPRFRDHGDHLGALLFVAPDRPSLHRLMAAADAGYTTKTGTHLPGLTGWIGFPDKPARYFAGRENLYFALEEDIHNQSTRVFQIPPCPPDVRAKLGQPTTFQFHRTELLPALPREQQRINGREQSAGSWQPKSDT